MQGCLETLLSNTAHSYQLTVFLQLSNMHLRPYMKAFRYKRFSTNLNFLCFATNYISVIVQAENVLNAGLHLFQIRDMEFPLRRHWFVNIRQLQSMQNNTFEGFHNKSCEIYCKYIKFMFIKVLTATASNSSRYVYTCMWNRLLMFGQV